MKSIKLFLHFFSIEFRKVMAYRWEFWTGLLGQTVIMVVISTFLWQSIFTANGVSQMRGMDLPQLVLYYLTVQLSFKILFGARVGFLSQDIYQGTLNKFLLYPRPIYLMKLGEFCANSFFFYIALLVFILIHRYTLGNHVSFLNLVSGSWLLFLGTICYYTIASCLEMIAFWAENMWSVGIMFRAFLQFCGGYFIPLTFFPEKIVTILYYTPFPHLLSTPVQFFMGKYPITELPVASMIIILWTAFFAFIYQWVWRRGNLKYSGVGI